MKRTFTSREILLICIAVVMALGIFYYEVVYKQVTESIAKYDTAELADELTLAEMQATQEAKMKKEIQDASSAEQTGTIEVYNNLANEVSVLGSILNGNADDIAITWASPTLTGTTVRRQASISFKTSDYSKARSLIQAISEMKYKNILNDVTVDNGKNNTSTSTTVSMTITFFETSNGAASTEGLVVVDDSGSTTN